MGRDGGYRESGYLKEGGGVNVLIFGNDVVSEDNLCKLGKVHKEEMD